MSSNKEYHLRQRLARPTIVVYMYIEFSSSKFCSDQIEQTTKQVLSLKKQQQQIEIEISRSLLSLRHHRRRFDNTDLVWFHFLVFILYI